MGRRRVEQLLLYIGIRPKQACERNKAVSSHGINGNVALEHKGSCRKATQSRAMALLVGIIIFMTRLAVQSSTDVHVVRHGGINGVVLLDWWSMTSNRRLWLSFQLGELYELNATRICSLLISFPSSG